MKLLFVDPGKSFQQMIASMFSGTDVEVGFACSIEEALRQAETPWQFVCLSLHLPDGSGLELARQLRRQWTCRTAPFILFTSDISASLAKQAALAGVTEVFLKKNLSDLLNFVGRYTVRVKKIAGRILYVEDSASQALVVQAMLNGIGLTVEWCGNFDEAWNAFLTRDYDLVLTDIVLGDNASGAKLAGAIRSLPDERGDVPIIAVTAYDETARRIDLFHLGVNDYVVKPIVEEELISRVRNHVERTKAERLLRRQRKRAFDETLVYLSRALNTGGGDLSGTLDQICHKAGEALGVGIVAIWQFDGEQTAIECRARYAEGVSSEHLPAELRMEDFPGYFTAVLSERVIVANDVRSHPATVELNEVYSVPLGIGALLDIPLGPAERRMGVLAFEHLGGQRYWTVEEESFAAAVGDLVTLAFESHERWLADQQIRLAGLVFEAASEAIMVCDRSHRIVTVNEAYSSITGYLPDEVVGTIPPIFRAGQRDTASGSAMWLALDAEGKWQGEVQGNRKDGSPYPKRLSINVVKNDKGEVSHFIAVFTDVTTEKEGERQLRYLAYHDVLTELPNRVFAETTLAEQMERSRCDGLPLTVMSIELDRFKRINSAFSHAVGDLLLQEAARRLRGALGEGAQLARWSGAGFVIILPQADMRTAVVAAQRCIDAFMRPFLVTQSELLVTISIGLGMFPEHGGGPNDLLKHAMQALSYAKDNGGNRYVFFSAEMEQRTHERLILEARLRRAIEQQHFVLHYQPKVDAVSGAAVGMEALLRWSDPIEGLIPPGNFIELAEETGQIFPINDWVLYEACRQNALWLTTTGRALPVSVNLPASSFTRADLLSQVRRVLLETGLPAELLELELTESAMIDDPQRVSDICGELKAMGVRVAIDDFGTGYSSLAYLRRLPVDTLKIDRSFVSSLHVSDDDLVIVSSIIGLAKNLRLTIVAEGVERDSQVDALRKLGCDQLQGFLFSRPLPADEFAQRYLSAA